MKKKLLISAAVLLLLGGIFTVVCLICDWPPPRLILEYGFPPVGGPTGRRLTIESVEFLELSPGYFRMGSDAMNYRGSCSGRLCDFLGLPSEDKPVPSNEMPLRWIEFPRPHWISRTEITNLSYERFDPKHARGSSSNGDPEPVVNVSWLEASEFCQWLTRNCGNCVRLPTEAEWERAGRAGSITEHSSGLVFPDPLKYSWYRDNSGHNAQKVAILEANSWGLFDFDGNVSEWCADAYCRTYGGPSIDGPAPEELFGEDARMQFKVVRGSSFNCRAATWRVDRFRRMPFRRSDEVGLRLAISLSE